MIVINRSCSSVLACLAILASPMPSVAECLQRVRLDVFAPDGTLLEGAAIRLRPVTGDKSPIELQNAKTSRVRCTGYQLNIDPPQKQWWLDGYHRYILVTPSAPEVRRVILDYRPDRIEEFDGPAPTTEIIGVVKIPNLEARALVARAVALADRESFQTADAEIIDGKFHINRVGEGPYVVLLLDGFRLIAAQAVHVSRGREPTEVVFSTGYR